MSWMTKSRSRSIQVTLCVAFLASLVLAGCVSSSGVPAARIAESDIAAAYLPLRKRVNLGIDSDNGAAVVIAPGIAVTNAHNRNLVDPASVIGARRDYDLLFFRTSRKVAPATAQPVAGGAVTAYGQGVDGELRTARGVIRQVKASPGATIPDWFTFAGNAGPGFSGGPVLDAAGRLIGITFGYKDSGRERLIYAYDMARVRAEFSALPKRPN
jgi:outer membrane murein-binding lipoprotein Lpp